jgi:hypothetical protein
MCKCIWITLLLGSSIARTASADGPRYRAIADLERGNTIFIRQLEFTLSGAHRAEDLKLSKPVNTLDATISARELGLNVDLQLPLYAKVSGDTITWTFDVAPAPAINLGWPNYLVRVRGSFVMRAALIPGNFDPRCSGAPCPYSVWLTSLPASSITITVKDLVSAHDHAASDIVVLGYGGVRRPRLATFSLSHRPGTLCAARRPLPLSAQLTASAERGAWIPIRSSDPVHVRVLGATMPATGPATVPVMVATGWSGRAVLTAAAGGVSISRDIEVRPASACGPSRVDGADAVPLRAPGAPGGAP